MKKLLRFRKILTFVMCGVLTIGAMTAALDHYEKNGIYAQNKAELEQQKKQNQNQIDQLENELQSLQASKDKEKAYQDTLSQQIAVMEENLAIVQEEMNRINSEIITATDNINNLNDEIAVQEVKVADNTEVFKQRLKAMYVTGNDSLATAVLGSTDFYDMISRAEMVNKIADHDSELIENLKNDIDSLETSKSALETEKLTLEMKQQEQQAKKEEFDAAIEEYNEAVKKSQAEIDRLNSEVKLTKEQIAERQKEIEKANAEIDAIVKREAEAAAKKRAEEAAAKKKAQQTSAKSSSGGSVYKQAPAGSSVPASNVGGFQWPVGYYVISSGYGPREDGFHGGIDITGSYRGAIQGAAVNASKGGTVYVGCASCTHNSPNNYCRCGGGYGNYVIITHDDGTSTVYGHMQSVYVSSGQYVSQGQAIGEVGCTGSSSGFHLHFEIRINGQRVNPQLYVKA